MRIQIHLDNEQREAAKQIVMKISNLEGAKEISCGMWVNIAHEIMYHAIKQGDLSYFPYIDGDVSILVSVDSGGRAD